MARLRVLQNSLITGVIAPTLLGRVDLEKYYNAVEEAENVVIMPHGGMERRSGLKYLTEVATGARLFSFEFSISQNYVMVMSTTDVKIYLPESGTVLATEAWTVTADQLNEMDIIQSADTVIITHEDFNPRQIQRQGSDTSWAISDITLTNIPQFDFGSGDEPVWSATRGWLRTCTFHQGRLWFGGSKSKPTSVWASVINDFFNFDDGGTDVQPDDGIFDVLDTDQFNAIQNIVSGTKLQVLTAGGEFINTEDIITPSSSSWIRYTGYGAARVKPVTLDGSTYFMDRFRKTVRGFIYDFETGGYTTPPVSILAEHIINDVQDLDIVRGSSISVSNLMYLVNADGTVAVFNTMSKENISGWTKWTTTGTFKRVTVTGDVVTFIVERDGTQYLEVLDDSVLLDHAFKATSSDKVEVDQVLFDNEIRVVGDSITQTDIAAVDESGTYYAYADDTVDEIYAGLNYTVKVKSLPVAANTQSEGNIVHLPKRITRCILQLYNARGIYVNDQLVTNRKFGDPTDEVFTPVTGIESVYLLGYNTKAQVEITQQNPDPMTLLSLDLEVSY